MKEGVSPGTQASVYIKNIIPEKMKIKLIIIDTFESSLKPSRPKYFFDGRHMDSFLYSPTYCDKTVETVFTQL